MPCARWPTAVALAAAVACRSQPPGEVRAPAPSTVPSLVPVVDPLPDPMRELDLEDVERLAMEMDSDGDGVVNGRDTCPFAANPDQKDSDGDGYGDPCDPGDTLKPVVRIVEPRNGARFEPGTSITVRATARDPDGRIVSVQFDQEEVGQPGPSGLGSARTPPFEWRWQPLPGRYRLTATALDDDGAERTSAPVAVIVLGADLGVTQDASDTRRWGARLEFTLVVTNQGPEPVRAARVVDDVPAQLTDVRWTCRASSGSRCPASGRGTLDASVDLRAGGEATFLLSATIVPGTDGRFENVVTVAHPSPERDPADGNNTARYPVEIMASVQDPPTMH